MRLVVSRIAGLAGALLLVGCPGRPTVPRETPPVVAIDDSVPQTRPSHRAAAVAATRPGPQRLDRLVPEVRRLFDPADREQALFDLLRRPRERVPTVQHVVYAEPPTGPPLVAVLTDRFADGSGATVLLFDAAGQRLPTPDHAAGLVTRSRVADLTGDGRPELILDRPQQFIRGMNPEPPEPANMHSNAPPATRGTTQPDVHTDDGPGGEPRALQVLQLQPDLPALLTVRYQPFDGAGRPLAWRVVHRLDPPALELCAIDPLSAVMIQPTRWRWDASGARFVGPIGGPEQPYQRAE